MSILVHACVCEGDMEVPVINFRLSFYSSPTAVYFQDQFTIQGGLRSSNINQGL